MGAGTDSRVLLSIHGDRGNVSSGPLRYDSSKRDAFAKGALDKFELELNNVGQISGIKLEQKDKKEADPWKIEFVKIYHNQNVYQ